MTTPFGGRGLDKNPPVNAEELEGQAKVNGPEYVAAGNKLRSSEQPLHRSCR